MPTVLSRAGEVYYEEHGQGLPLVLLHANPGDHRDYAAVIEPLAQHYRVFALDWPGYGESPAPTPPQSASAMLFADVLADFAAALDLKKAIFLGNSVGGYAAARLAIIHPERVGALILASPGGFGAITPLTWFFCQIKGREAVTRLIAGRFARLYLKKRNTVVQQILARTDAGRHMPACVAVDAAVWRSFLRPEHNLRRRAGGINVPTLLIFGRYDPVIRAKHDGQSAARSIPSAQLVILDCGHEPFAEDPQVFLEVLRPFLQKMTTSQEVSTNYVASDT